MRTYHGRAYRQLDDGSIELEGVWAGVQGISLLLALGLSVLLFLRNRILLFPTLGFAVYLLLLPTRRRVVFDVSARALRIDHAGPWQERRSVRIPFEQVRSVYFESAGSKGGRPVRRVYALTDGGEVYLMSLFQGEVEAGLSGRLEALLAQG